MGFRGSRVQIPASRPSSIPPAPRRARSPSLRGATARHRPWLTPFSGRRPRPRRCAAPRWSPVPAPASAGRSPSRSAERGHRVALLGRTEATLRETLEPILAPTGREAGPGGRAEGGEDGVHGAALRRQGLASGGPGGAAVESAWGPAEVVVPAAGSVALAPIEELYPRGVRVHGRDQSGRRLPRRARLPAGDEAAGTRAARAGPLGGRDHRVPRPGRATAPASGGSPGWWRRSAPSSPAAAY